MADGQLFIDGIEGMSQGIGDVLLMQIGRKIINVFPEVLKVLVLPFGSSIDDHVDLTAVFREVGGHFFTDERLGQMSDFQGSFDGIMIGYGYVGHSPGTDQMIQRLGVRITFRTSQLLQHPF